jgi:hypothetical protein
VLFWRLASSASTVRQRDLLGSENCCGDEMWRLLTSVTSQSNLKSDFSTISIVVNNIIHNISIMRDVAATTSVTDFYPQERGKDKPHHGKTARKRSHDEVEVRSIEADFPATLTDADRMPKNIEPTSMMTTRHLSFNRNTDDFS